MTRPTFLPLLLLALNLALAHAQQATVATDTAPPPSKRFPADWYPPDDEFAAVTTPLAGKPYIGTLIITSSHSGGDKAPKVTTQALLHARDSSGRIHEESETWRPGPDGMPAKVRVITATDPVSHCTFVWQEPWVREPQIHHGPTATVTCNPRVAKLRDGSPLTSVGPEGTTEHFGELRTVEKLPPVSEDGLSLIGFRVTLKRRDGTAARVAGEMRYSPELDEMIRERLNLPSAPGETNSMDLHLVDIRREEPDGKLFYPPDGYVIQSEPPDPPSARHMP